MVRLVSLGGDPEFELGSESEFPIPASSYFPFSGEIGTDGCEEILELRPREGKNPKEFQSHFRRVLRRFKEEFPGLGMSTKGDSYPLGGHIHFGIANWTELSWETCKEIIKRVVYRIDDYLGDFFIDWSGRARGSYASRNSYQDKDWGFEYRTPPAAIFASPQILDITLKAMWGIAKDSLNGESFLAKTWIQVLRKYITDEEIDYMESFRPPRGDVLEFWGFNPIRFPEIWVQYNPQDHFSRVFKDFVNKHLVPLLKEIDVQIWFKGLHQKRGYVSGFPQAWYWSVWRVEPIPEFKNEWLNDDLYVCWLPYNIRTTTSMDLLVNYLLPLLKKELNLT